MLSVHDLRLEVCESQGQQLLDPWGEDPELWFPACNNLQCILKDPLNSRVLGPRYHQYCSIWALKLYYFGSLDPYGVYPHSELSICESLQGKSAEEYPRAGEKTAYIKESSVDATIWRAQGLGMRV